jgi:hypothetical protein
LSYLSLQSDFWQLLQPGLKGRRIKGVFAEMMLTGFALGMCRIPSELKGACESISSL